MKVDYCSHTSVLGEQKETLVEQEEALGKWEEEKVEGYHPLHQECTGRLACIVQITRLVHEF